MTTLGDWDSFQYAIDRLHMPASVQLFIAGSNGCTLDLNEYNMGQKNMSSGVGDYVDQEPLPLCNPGY